MPGPDYRAYPILAREDSATKPAMRKIAQSQGRQAEKEQAGKENVLSWARKPVFPVDGEAQQKRGADRQG